MTANNKVTWKDLYMDDVDDWFSHLRIYKLDNVKECLSILNQAKGWSLELNDDDNLTIDTRLPVGVSRQEYNESLNCHPIGLTDGEIDFSFEIGNLAALKLKPTDDDYITEMKKIMARINDAYKCELEFRASVSQGLSLSGAQTITGTKVYASYPSANTLSATLTNLGSTAAQFNNVYAQDVMLNGSTSVKDKFTDLQNENEALKDRLEQLEQTLMQVLQRGNHD